MYKRQVFGWIGKDRLIMVAVRRRDIAAATPGLKVVFAHQAADLLVIDDQPALPQRGADASPAIGFELVADRRPVSYTHLDVYKRQSNAYAPPLACLA